MLVMAMVASVVVMDARAMISVLAEPEALLVFGAIVVSIHGVATCRCWRVLEPLVQVEHAWGSCLRSLAWRT
jgi:hypothetical protein